MNRIDFSETARSDINAIWDYVAIQRQSPENADGLIEFLWERLEFLAENPLMGEVREDLFPGLRCFSADSYVIFYTPHSKGIRVERLLHGSRDVGRLF